MPGGVGRAGEKPALTRFGKFAVLFIVVGDFIVVCLLLFSFLIFFLYISMSVCIKTHYIFQFAKPKI